MKLGQVLLTWAMVSCLVACAVDSPERRGTRVERLLSLPAAVPTAEGNRGGGSGAVVPGDVLSPYLDFIGRKQSELSRPDLPEGERRIGTRALLFMRAQVYGGTERALADTSPEALFRRCRLEALAREREDAERARKRDEKFEECWRWALWQWGESVRGHFYRAGPAYLVTESPQREASRDLLVHVVLDWAATHTDDPAFLERSPSEVALYLLARNSVLASVVEQGKRANPILDYTADLDRTRYTPEQLAAELIVGFIPGVGEVAIAYEALTGVSITGHELEEEDRILLGVLAVVPFAGSVLAKGETLAKALAHSALLTGHSLHEAEVLARVASHLSPSDVAEIERMVRGISQGRHLNPEELAKLNEIAGRLEVPIAKLGELVLQGGKVPLLGSRVAASGAPLAIGSAEHLAQCWIEYQFRYPARYKRFSYAVDAVWEAAYRRVIRNKEAGGVFEKEVLEANKYQKNVMPMMPPPGSKMEGFIADAVKENPEALVWGKPYHFVEVKGRKEMALTGNLEAMIEYVKEYGGHLEVWFRSAKHAAGETRLTKNLEQELKELIEQRKVKVERFPK